MEAIQQSLMGGRGLPFLPKRLSNSNLATVLSSGLYLHVPHVCPMVVFWVSDCEVVRPDELHSSRLYAAPASAARQHVRRSHRDADAACAGGHLAAAGFKPERSCGALLMTCCDAPLDGAFSQADDGLRVALDLAVSVPRVGSAPSAPATQQYGPALSA